MVLRASLNRIGNILVPRGAVVLMYHGVGEPAPRAETHYTVETPTFRRHMERLIGGGTPITLAELAGEGPPQGGVCVTFDDGERSVFTEARPVLASLGIPATVFITTGWIGTPGYLSEEEIQTLAAEGWSIGSHGVTHRYLSDLNPEEIREELIHSKERLESLLGTSIDYLSLPGGRWDRRVHNAAVGAGYSIICTSRVGLFHSSGDLSDVPRFMITRPWTTDFVGKLMERDPLAVGGLQVRQAILGGAKRCLGNRWYDRVRAVAFRLKIK